MYDKPDSQYSQLVMVVRKAETETPGSVPEVKAKSAVAETDSQPRVASSDLPYEAITQQIAHLMSAITNQNSGKNNEGNGSNRVMEMVSSLTQIQEQSYKDQKEIGKI